MNNSRNKLAKTGTKLSPNLTVLGVIDGGSLDPVYIVWNHKCWCPMACKVFATSERAQREADVLASLSHPNIVRLLSLDPPVHLLMPFLEGPTLHNFIRSAPKKRLSADNAIRIAIHIGAALQHVHGQGLLHMDVKPSNVIIARGGTPVLFDFGTARRQTMPRPKEIIGTNGYISPEECRMDRAGPSADVFSLGVTLFDMLTRELPFPVRSKMKPFPQLDTPPRDLQKIRPNLPKALCNLVGRCLEHDPAKRPQLPELLPALNALIRSGPAMWPARFSPVLGISQRDDRTTAREMQLA